MALSKIDADGVTGLQETLTATTTVPSEGGAVTTNLVQGLIKWWINQDMQTLSAQNTRNSFNISSYVDGGTGKTELTFSNNMGDADYCVTMGQGDGGGFNDSRSLNHGNETTMSTSRFDFYSYNISGSYLDDYQWAWLQSTGDLA